MPSFDLLASLRSVFAYPAFKPGQEEALRYVLSGRDTLVVMPTGSGKSLIYQLAALHLPGITLVVSPLIALMKDQVDQMARRRIPATFVNSSLDAAEQTQRRRKIAVGEYKIVLVAPERLRSRTFRETIAQMQISLLVVDEAHCLSQWGHDFRPDYLYIAEARRELSAPATLALTATATPRVQEDLLRRLDMPNAARLVAGFNRPNLTFEVVNTLTRAARLNYVHEFLRNADGAGASSAGIIYTGTRRDAEEVATFARDVAGVRAQHYHAGLDQATRAQVQDAFMAGDLPIVVATNAFGMGIDRPDVRWVLHYNMPGTVEAYYQEAGRAGRDELPARAVLLYSPHDVTLHEHFIEHGTPSRKELHAVHTYLASVRSGNSVLTEVIEQKIGLSDHKVRVALEQLASAGVLRMEVLSSGHLHTETQTLGDAKLDEIAQQALERQNYKRRLLEQMIGYAQTEGCRREFILRYFGDGSPPDAPVCCDNCLARQERQASEVSKTSDVSPEAKPIAKMSQAERAALIVLDTIANLPYEVGMGKLAQVLKGSASQDVARLKGSRNFGKFAQLRLSEIESLIEQLAMAGYITLGGGTLPTLKLTSNGRAALKQRQAIQVQLRPAGASASDQRQHMRGAGDTLALTEQMLKQGRSPQQIAAERGLTVGTIYSHLAQLIALRRVSVDDVIPAGVQKRVREAIAHVGSVEYLSPIKAQLPEEIDYGVIRCVVEAWKIEQTTI
jgi:ATP-dependent DNA helicase RecQ